MAVNIIRKFLMKKLMKPNAEGIMKIPEKGKIDFSEHFIKERLFTNGIDHRTINNERQLENILQNINDAEANKLKQEADRLGLNDPSKNKFMQKEGEVIKVDFGKPFKEEFADGGIAGLLGERPGYQIGKIVYDPLFNQKTQLPPSQGLGIGDVPSRINREYTDATQQAYNIGNIAATTGITSPTALVNLSQNPGAANMMRGMNLISSPETKTGFEKQGLSSDYRHALGTSALKDSVIDYLGSNLGIDKSSGILDAIGSAVAKGATVFEEGKDALSQIKAYNTQYPGEYKVDGLADYDFIPSKPTLSFEEILAQPKEDFTANFFAADQIPFGMKPVTKMEMIDAYRKFGPKLFMKQLQNKKKQDFQNIVKAAEQKKAADAAEKARLERLGKDKNRGGFDPSGPTQKSIRRDRADKSGKGHSGGFTNPGKGSYGPHMADGGRIGFSKGKLANLARRNFMKLLGGAAAGIGALKTGAFKLLGKEAAPIAKEVITTPAAAGKPAWFDALVTKVINEGDDVTKKFATKEREIVHATKIDEDAFVTVTRDLDSGTVRVDIDDVTTNVADEQGNAIVSMEVRGGQLEEGVKGKTPAEFQAVETDYGNYLDRAGDDYTTEVVENVVKDTKDLTADLTKVKMYAKGQKKPTIKEMMIQRERAKNLKLAEENPVEYASGRQPDIDYASGGIARMLGE
jgi:hypothetical protein